MIVLFEAIKNIHLVLGRCLHLYCAQEGTSQAKDYHVDFNTGPCIRGLLRHATITSLTRVGVTGADDDSSDQRSLDLQQYCARLIECWRPDDPFTWYHYVVVMALSLSNRISIVFLQKIFDY